MALVTDWQEPLEESLEKALSGDGGTEENLNRVRSALAMLNPDTEGAVRVRGLLEDRFQRLENRYLEAVRYLETAKNEKETEFAVGRLRALGGYRDSSVKIAEGMRQAEEFRARQRENDYQEAVRMLEGAKTRSETEYAVRRLKELEDYKDISERIAEGERRVETFRRQEEEAQARERAAAKKRRIAALASAAVLVIAAVIFFTVREQNRQKKIGTVKARIQTMISEGRETEIADPLDELTALGVPREELYALSETALESLALREGPGAAYALLDGLKKGRQSVADGTAFSAWVLRQCSAENLTAERRWEFARAYLDVTGEGKTDEGIRAAYSAYLLFEAGREESRSADEWNAWNGDMKPYMAVLPAEPESALLLSRRMSRDGVNLKTAFPDGIPVSLSVAGSVSALNKWLDSEDEDSVWPAADRVLPVSITEKAESAMYGSSHATSDALFSVIESLQADDEHYTVCFLAGDLTDIPEDYRAESFADCTAYIALQKSWVCAGYTYTTTTYTDGKTGIPRPYGGTTSNYRGYYAAMDAVALYSPADAGRFGIVSRNFHYPVMADTEWYERHKNGYSFLYTEENSLGVHDHAALQAEYRQALADMPSIWIWAVIHSENAGAADN